jgi:ABC-type branched-subunit amino acid transport system ATPase component
VFGALVVIALPELLSGLAEYRVLFFGVLLLIVLWIAPSGAAGALAARFPRSPGRAVRPADAGAVDFAVGGAPIELSVRSLGIRFGGLSAVSDLDFTAQSGQITSVIGPNGAGKTTVLNLICGFYQPDTGRITLAGRELAGKPAHAIARAGIARTFQTTQLFGKLTVLENLLVALQRGALGSPWRPLGGETGVAAHARALLAFVGYAGDADRPAAALPHIDKRLVEIARALALRPSVLMLDEPAAGLGRADTEKLGGLLRKIADAGIAVVLIEHDMSLVMTISDQVVVLDAGKRLAAGNVETVRRDPAVIKAYLGEGTFAAKPRPAGWQAGRDGLLATRDLGAGYGAAKVLEDVGIEVYRGELVAVLGANGAGKSTLMRSLAGLLRPVTGRILFAGAEVMLLPAHRLARRGLVLVPEGRQVFPELSVIDNIRLGAYARRDFDPREIDRMLSRFPSLHERRHNRAGLLSGGEQQMLAIARGLVAKPQALLLDEPSLGLAPPRIHEQLGGLAALRDAGITILLVDQMAALALAVSDRGYVIESGRIVHQGSAADIRDDPALERAYLGNI